MRYRQRPRCRATFTAARLAWVAPLAHRRQLQKSIGSMPRPSANQGERRGGREHAKDPALDPHEGIPPLHWFGGLQPTPIARTGPRAQQRWVHGNLGISHQAPWTTSIQLGRRRNDAHCQGLPQRHRLAFPGCLGAGGGGNHGGRRPSRRVASQNPSHDHISTPTPAGLCFHKLQEKIHLRSGLSDCRGFLGLRDHLHRKLFKLEVDLGQLVPEPLLQALRSPP